MKTEKDMDGIIRKKAIIEVSEFILSEMIRLKDEQDFEKFFYLDKVIVPKLKELLR